MTSPLKPRERDAILQSLRAGVVPRIGLQHIQVGRKEEVAAILRDLDRVAAGGATIRFIIGRFGAGKSFFLNLARMVALEKKFVVVQADITPDRRLHASGGQARSLYTELMHNMSAGAKRDGGALPGLVERWVSDVEFSIRQTDGDLQHAIYERLKPLQDLVSGYDFATVICKYVEGFQQGNDALMQAALRWLRAEYTTKTEARQDLGVRSIIDDQDIYDYLKLMAAFTQLAGYAGLLVNLDEMGVLSHRLNNTPARNANYEMILRIVNDCLQGSVAGLGVVFAGTDAFLDDRRRGLASYEALATRLADNTFAVGGLRDYSGPVIRLQNLMVEDLYVLLHNIRHVFASGDKSRYLVPDAALKGFIQHCACTLGAEFYQTPRDAVKGFVGLLSVLEQNPGTDWQLLLNGITLERSVDPDSLPMFDEESPATVSGGQDELATFRL
ncbi:MAG: hypothetical protein BWY76_00694 [bacterium ADurb.Bin429]|nr:MAG: hypothetical protein BWY76_00694 [bacterium ADurb.Bin429]